MPLTSKEIQANREAYGRSVANAVRNQKKQTPEEVTRQLVKIHLGIELPIREKKTLRT